MGVLLPRVQCKCFFFYPPQQIVYCIYVACTSVASSSLSSPLISTLCSDQTKTKTAEIKLTHQHQACSSLAQSADALTSWNGRLNGVWLNRMWPMSSAVFEFFLLAIWSWNQTRIWELISSSLVSLPVILTVMCSTKAQKERNKNLTCNTVRANARERELRRAI